MISSPSSTSLGARASVPSTGSNASKSCHFNCLHYNSIMSLTPQIDRMRDPKRVQSPMRVVVSHHSCCPIFIHRTKSNKSFCFHRLQYNLTTTSPASQIDRMRELKRVQSPLRVIVSHQLSSLSSSPTPEPTRQSVFSACTRTDRIFLSSSSRTNAIFHLHQLPTLASKISKSAYQSTDTILKKGAIFPEGSCSSHSKNVQYCELEEVEFSHPERMMRTSF